MILMIQKNRVTSGTLFSIVRAREVWRCVVVIAVMDPRVRDRTLQLPDCMRGLVLDAVDRGQDEHEAAAGATADDDVAAAGARQAPRERKPQPRGARCVAAAA